MKRFKTHVPGLDDLLGGGLPRRGVTVLLGPPGSPRQLLLENVLWNALEHDHRVLLLATSTCPYELLKRAEEYGRDLEGHHRRGDLTILNAFSVRAGVYHRAVGEIIQELSPTASATSSPTTTPTSSSSTPSNPSTATTTNATSRP